MGVTTSSCFCFFDESTRGVTRDQPLDPSARTKNVASNFYTRVLLSFLYGAERSKVFEIIKIKNKSFLKINLAVLMSKYVFVQFIFCGVFSCR